MSTKLNVALTHDVDRTAKTYQYFTHFVKAIKNKNFKEALYHISSINKSDTVYWNFEEIIDLENKYGVKSTFFFLIESIPFRFYNISNWQLSLGRYDINESRIISIMHYLDKNGWEIGLHGSYLSFQDINLLKIEKNMIEKLIGHHVMGIRQHYLNLNENTWSLQKEVGFMYDSSWGLTRAIGFKDSMSKPFQPFSDKFTVFPLAIMDSCYMNTSNRENALKKIIDTCIEEESILVINWHSNNFHEKEYPSYKKSYCKIIELCLDNNAEFNTLSYYYKNINS